MHSNRAVDYVGPRQCGIRWLSVQFLFPFYLGACGDELGGWRAACCVIEKVLHDRCVVVKVFINFTENRS